MKRIYGIGVGPGDSDYITLRGYKLIRGADVVFLPSNGGKSLAGEIAEKFIDDKKRVYIEFPMGKDNSKRYKEAADTVDDHLKDGGEGVFLTLGDPMVYSTFSYIMTELEKIGINVESIPGISSFNAAANRIKMPLASKGQKFYLTDGDVDEDILKYFDTVCILKTSRNKEKVLDMLERYGFAYTYIKRCGFLNERIMNKADDILEDDDYMSLILGRRKND